MMIYRKIVQTMHLQGSGRLSQEEQKAGRQEIWLALEQALAQRRTAVAGDEDAGGDSTKDKTPFWCLGGQHATEADATVYGFINSALIAQSSPETMRFAKGLPAVMDYATRIHDRYFPDYEKW